MRHEPTDCDACGERVMPIDGDCPMCGEAADPPDARLTFTKENGFGAVSDTSSTTTFGRDVSWTSNANGGTLTINTNSPDVWRV